MRKPANQKPGAKTLAEVNAKLTAARDAYRKAQAALFKSRGHGEESSRGPSGRNAGASQRESASGIGG
jgi:hypothetical protein